jgi:hypothetical protein
MMLLLLLLLLFLCIYSNVTNNGSLDPPSKKIRDEIISAVTDGKKGGDRPSAICTIMVFVQGLIGDHESENVHATAHILRQVEALPDTKPGHLEASVNKYLQDKREYLKCKYFLLQRSIRTDVVLSKGVNFGRLNASQATSYVLCLNCYVPQLCRAWGGIIRLFEKKKGGSFLSTSRADEMGRRRGSKVETGRQKSHRLGLPVLPRTMCNQNPD